MRLSLLFLALPWVAQANTPNVNLLKYELQLKRRGELLSERSLVRTKALMGIDPESCQRVTEPRALAELLKKQIEIVRRIGELNHCEHMASSALTQIDNELINNTLPPAFSLPESRPPVTRSGKALPVEFQYDYASSNTYPNGRQHIDGLFKTSSATHFAGLRLSEEGMHALRVFYGAERPIGMRAYEAATYPSAENEVFMRYPECRIIISGDIEFTSAIASDPRDAGHNSECARACDQKLQQLVAEKKPTGYLMTCHHLGEIITMTSKGTPAQQGIKSLAADGTGKFLLGQCLIKVKDGETLSSTPVAYRSECLGRFKDAYFEYERKMPFEMEYTSAAPTLEVYLNETRLAAANVIRPSMAQTGKYSGECVAEALILLKNQDRVHDVIRSANPTGGCLAWCNDDFKALLSTTPTPQRPRGLQGSAAPKWFYRCTDASGHKLMQCAHNSRQGCRL